MTSRARRLSRQAAFNVLMLGALAAALLPAAFTGWARVFTQPLGLIESPVRSATMRLKGWGGDARVSQLSSEQISALIDRNEELERQVLALNDYQRELDLRLADVTGFHNQLSDSRSRIIIARVIAPIGDPRRDVLVLAKGSLAGVRSGLWVAAGSPNTSGASGRELLARQWVIGRIIEARPYESLVMLVSDRDFKQRVQLARVDEEAFSWEPVGSEQMLYGQGHGRMLIREATRDYHELGAHLVLLGAAGTLPITMPVGEVVESRKLDQTQLHFDLEVSPLGRVRDLDYVYIVDPGA